MELLFDHINSNSGGFDSSAPLASRLRPRNFDEFTGQKHLVSEGTLCRRAVDADCFSSIILNGPPGTGKTSLATLIAGVTSANFVAMTALTASVSDVRKEIKKASDLKAFNGKKTILFIDELHRFNKAQQDSLLKDIEEGNIRFIGATTHNPNFYIIPPLVSRSHVFKLESHSEEDICELLLRSVKDERAFPEKTVEFVNDSEKILANLCEGDARKALGALELAVLTTDETDGKIEITKEIIESCIQKKTVNYDDDNHYDTASAFIKSMRGSDPDAAVYWLAKMLHAGEDIRFIARRIMIFASEDVGNADPRALQVAVSAMQAVEAVGMPEARIILSQAVTYCATAPKSNAAYKAINMALTDIEKGRILPVPYHLRDPHSSGYVKDMGNYQYPHDSENGFVVQEYLGVDTEYYTPVERGYESRIKERMDYWKKLREASNDQG